MTGPIRGQLERAQSGQATGCCSGGGGGGGGGSM
jgi:hypothetical protein